MSAQYVRIERNVSGNTRDGARLSVDAELDRLQRQTFGYFLHETNPANGLVIDKTAPDWPASIAATGFHGFYYHFLDMPTGRRAWQCELSTVDSTFLRAGALTAAMYFGADSADEEEIRKLGDALYRRAGSIRLVVAIDAKLPLYRRRFAPSRLHGRMACPVKPPATRPCGGFPVTGHL